MQKGRGLAVVLSLLGFAFGGELIYFYKSTCGYCTVQFEELQKHRECLSRHRVWTVDVDRHRDYARAWQVYLVPTMVLVEGGRYYKVEGVLLGENLRKFLLCDAKN